MEWIKTQRAGIARGRETSAKALARYPVSSEEGRLEVARDEGSMDGRAETLNDLEAWIRSEIEATKEAMGS